LDLVKGDEEILKKEMSLSIGAKDIGDKQEMEL